MDYREIQKNRNDYDKCRSLYLQALSDGIISELQYDEDKVNTLIDRFTFKLDVFSNFDYAVTEFNCDDSLLRQEFISVYPFIFNVFNMDLPQYFHEYNERYLCNQLKIELVRNRHNPSKLRELYYLALRNNLISELEYSEEALTNIKEGSQTIYDLFHNFSACITRFRYVCITLRIAFAEAYPIAFNVFGIEYTDNPFESNPFYTGQDICVLGDFHKDDVIPCNIPDRYKTEKATRN